MNTADPTGPVPDPAAGVDAVPAEPSPAGDLRRAAGPGYAREWALFLDYTAATGQPALPTTVTALAGFLTQVPGAAATQGRRVAAIAAAHRGAGYLLTHPADTTAGPAAPPAAGPDAGELLAACPTRGWPDGLAGRRDGFLIVLTTILGFPHAHARRIRPAHLAHDERGWRIQRRQVPVETDPRRCPTCTLVRWLDALGTVDGLGRGSARMYLHATHAPTSSDPHQHTPTEPQRWHAAAQLLPAIDRHGWIADYQPMSTRTIHTRLHLATTRAADISTAGTSTAGTNTAGTNTAGTASGPPTLAGSQPERQPRTAADLADVLDQLDQVAADADALNARIEALLAGDR